MKSFYRHLTILTLCIPAVTQAADLLEVYQSALKNDPEYRADQAQFKIDEEQVPAARALLLPTIGGEITDSYNRLEIRSGNFTGQAGVRSYNKTTWGLNLDQSIYDHSRWLGLDRANELVAQAEITLARKKQDLIIRLADAYFDILRAQDEVEFSQSRKDASENQLSQALERFDVGLLAITDAEESRAEFDLDQARFIEASNSLENARENLRILTGDYFEYLNELDEDITLLNPEPNIIQEWELLATQQNLNILANQKALAASKLEISRQQAGHYPTLDLVGSHGRTNAKDGFSGPSDRFESQIGVVINVPIFSGLSVVSNTRKARAEYIFASEQLERFRREAITEARRSFNDVNSSIERIIALRQAVKSNRTAVDATLAGFDVGTRTSVEILSAQRDMFEAERDLAGAHYDYVNAVLALKRAAGTLSEEDLHYINTLLQ